MFKSETEKEAYKIIEEVLRVHKPTRETQNLYFDQIDHKGEVEAYRKNGLSIPYTIDFYYHLIDAINPFLVDHSIMDVLNDPLPKGMSERSDKEKILKVRVYLKRAEEFLLKKEMFRLTYGDDCVVKINGDFFHRNEPGSPNDKVMRVCYENPNSLLKDSTIRANIGQTRGKIKAYKSVVSSMGFSGDLRTAFFPQVSRDGIFFRNPVTMKVILENGLKLPEIENMIVARQKHAIK